MSASASFRRRGVLLLLCLLLAGAAAVSLFLWPGFLVSHAPALPSPEESLHVYFLNVGEGDCTVVRQGEHTLLIDAGLPEQGNRVYSFLRSTLGITRLDAVILTHPHNDHIGGFAKVLSEYEADTVYAPSFDGEGMEKLASVLEKQRVAGARLIEPRFGEAFSLGGAEVTMYRDEQERPADDQNNRSIVTRIVFGKTAFLIAADAEGDAETCILAGGAELSADVLRVGHHGSITSSTPAFLKAVAPDWAVISVNRNSPHGLPDSRVLSDLTVMGCRVMSTADVGSICAVSDGNAVAVTALYGVQEENVMYVGNISSGKYHDPSCSDAAAIAEKNLVTFASEEEALDRGYVPAGCCVGKGGAAASSVPLPAAEENTVYVGTVNSDKYHKPGCKNAVSIPDKNRITFASAEEAERAGYMPAGCCLAELLISEGETPRPRSGEGIAYVGTVNSDKYHKPGCSNAAGIPDKNLITFASAEEAEQAGYVPAGCCVGK